MTAEAFTTIWQVAIILAGAALAVRLYQHDRKGPVAPDAHPLALWEVDRVAFAFAAIRVLVVMFGFQITAGVTLRYFQPDLDQTTGKGLLILGAAGQLGMLAGLAIARWFLPKTLPPPPWEEPQKLPDPLPRNRIFLAGVTTFLVTSAVVTLLTLLWRLALEAAGYPAADQEMVDLLRASNSWVEPAGVILLACVLAPVTEEALFRGGLFRFCRGRMPRWAAFLVPAVLFGLIHFSAVAFPGLVVLALLFSVAYERTGRIAVPIIAHALFNLQTLLITLIERP